MRWSTTALCFLLCFCSACGTSSTLHSPGSEASRSAVIVVAGFYGTKLARVDNESLLWVTASQALGGKQRLTLPLPDLALEGVTLRPSGILDEVTVVPWLYSVGFYRPLLDELGSLHDGQGSVSPLNFDWRLDLMEVVRTLSAEVRRLKSEGMTHITLVAHSLGGLIVSYYLRYGDQELDTAEETWEGTRQVEAVAMGGVPFLGTMWSFRNMQYGRLVGLNKTILDHQALSSFPASYYMLPAREADVLLTPTMQPIRGGIRTTANWRQQGWGLLQKAAPYTTEIVEARDTYTSYWLHRSQRFHDLLHAPLAMPPDRSIPLLYLYANGQPTLDGAVWIAEEEGQHQVNLVFDKDQFEQRLPRLDPHVVYHDGDGSVTVRSASLPPAYQKAFQVTTQRLQNGHMELMTGREGRRQIAAFLEHQAKEASGHR